MTTLASRLPIGLGALLVFVKQRAECQGLWLRRLRFDGFDQLIKPSGGTLRLIFSLGSMRNNGHCHSDEDPAIYRISFVDSDIFAVDGPYDTNDRLGAVKVRDIFQMNISFLLQEGWGVTCGGDALPDVLTGSLSLTPFDIPALLLRFEHNGAEHYVQSLSTLPDTWPPTDPNVTVEVKDKNGQWEITTKGQNHRDGCTGEGGPDSKNPENIIHWTARVTLLSS